MGVHIPLVGRQRHPHRQRPTRPFQPPIGEEVMHKLNTLGDEGWEIDHITAAPLTTGWISFVFVGRSAEGRGLERLNF